MTYANLSRSAAALAFVLFGLSGCSRTSTAVPVNGVLLWDDQKPVSGASITFFPAVEGGRPASGISGKDGTFELSTFSQGDGAVPGDYTVVVTKAAGAATSAAPPTGSSPEDMAKAMKKAQEAADRAPKVADPIPEIYKNVTSSPLKWRVEAGDKKVELKLKRI
jgi:hypothetical protein